jgi:anti-sigma B factor antagonist
VKVVVNCVVNAVRGGSFSGREKQDRQSDFIFACVILCHEEEVGSRISETGLCKFTLLLPTGWENLSRLVIMPFDGPLTYSRSNGAGDGIAILTLEGPLTLRNIFAFQKDLTVNPPPVLIFDLSKVEYMDSAGIGVLINYYVAAQKHGRRMTLVGANKRLDALLEMTKVKELLKNYPTVEAAEASFSV